jgi:hypothetical protein
MAPLTPFLCLLWVPVVIAFFPLSKQPHRAIIVWMLVGLLYLPEVGSAMGVAAGVNPIKLGPLHFNKDMAINYALLFAVIVHDLPRLLSGWPRWVDLPMIAWCLCPIASALTNEPPPDGSWPIRDGLSQSWHYIAWYGFAYLLGRMYLTTPGAFRDLIIGTAMAAIIYLPLCLIELRISPQLHRFVYGFAQHDFNQTLRFGGYRPMVFMKHGLTLATWIVTALIMIAFLTWTTSSSKLRGASRESARLTTYVVVLLPMAILMKSTAAALLGVGGWGVLCLSRWLPSRIWLLLLMAVPPVYVSLRISGKFSGESLVQLAEKHVSHDRAQSLKFRLDNENLLAERALEKRVYGWGGWGRARIQDEWGKDRSVTDGLWIITFGDRGFVGLVALLLALHLPVYRFLFLFPPRTWSDPRIAPMAVCSVVTVLWSIDCLLNAGFNHTFLLIVGGLASVSGQYARQIQAEQKVRRPRRFAVPMRTTAHQEVPTS